MNNRFKNIISFLISIIFILSGVFLVYKTEANVIDYFFSIIINKNLYDTDTNIDIEETDIISTTDSEETTSSIELIYEEKTINSIDNIDNTYKKTYLDPNNPDIMHVIDGNYDKSFFNNSLFIGDSRVDGLKLYSPISEAHYFCSTGLTEFSLFKEPLVVNNVGNIYLEYLIGSNKYDKIYFQMGINSLGTKFNSHVREFSNAINKIHTLSPNSKIYIVSNMHVTNKRSKESEYINNTNIDLFNKAIMQLANNESIFYIDINKFLDDNTGALNEEYTRDGVHLLPKYYDIEMDVFYNFSSQ